MQANKPPVLVSGKTESVRTPGSMGSGSGGGLSSGGSGGGTIGSNGTDIDITPGRLKNAGRAGRFRSVEGRRRGLIRGIHFLDRSNHFLDRMLKFWLANARPNRQTLRYPPLTETAFSQESNM